MSSTLSEGGKSMTKWRYHSLLMRDLSIADTKLNAEGERGWELVSMCLIDANTARAFFKQPVEEGMAVVRNAEPAALSEGDFTHSPF
jgi:hypothetical protein